VDRVELDRSRAEGMLVPAPRADPEAGRAGVGVPSGNSSGGPALGRARGGRAGDSVTRKEPERARLQVAGGKQRQCRQ